MVDGRQMCCVCGEPVSERFKVPCDYRRPEIAREYSVYWCQQCDLGQIQPRPSLNEIADSYNVENYYTHDGSTDERASRSTPGSRTILDRLRTHLSWRLDCGTELSPEEIRVTVEDRKPTICEIGCGNGQCLLQFAGAGYDVFGVEPDSSALDVANSELAKVGMEGRVLCGTAEELPESVRSRRYDVVLMSHVLEHCLDVNEAISNSRELLSANGVLVIEVPNCAALGFQQQLGAWPWADIPRHLNFFTPRSLELLLTKHGLQVSTTVFRGYCRQFSKTWLENERQIYSAFARHQSTGTALPGFNSRAWRLLIRSVFARPALKYDSVRIAARIR
ncbi:MAG: class I SAM-dependent methyltransferase [Planctomyces sp.]|nr:class I SAM-dependent methyltransferase [Planctomyces sp.]